IELVVGAHGRIDMLDRMDGGILGGGGARHRDQRLAGRVRHEMEMEEACVPGRHRDGLWKTVDRSGEGHVAAASASRSADGGKRTDQITREGGRGGAKVG